MQWTATYTYTAEGYRWINHEILSELLFAWFCDHLGSGALLGFKCALGLAILAMAAWGKRVHPLVMASVWVLVALNLSYYWAARPQIFSFFFFSAMIFLTDACFRPILEARGGTPDALRSTGEDSETSRGWGWLSLRACPAPYRRLVGLWAMPPLMAVWANTHGGFLAGAAIFTVILLGRKLELRGAPKQVQRYLTGILVIALAATLANPYGAELHLWLARALRAPRPEIDEWHPPNWWAPEAVKLWMLVGLSLGGMLLTRRRRDPVQLAVLLLVLWQVTSHQRHIPFLAVLFAHWLPVHLESAVAWLRPLLPSRQASTSAGLTTMRRGWLVPAAGVLATVLVGWVLYVRFEAMRVDASQFPVAAVQYIHDRQLGGKAVVSAAWAQYVLSTVGARHAGDPGLQVAFDGRFRTCYPQAVLDMYFDFDRGIPAPGARHRSPNSGPCDPQKILEFGDPELVLIRRDNQHAGAAIQGQPGRWVLLYQDQLAQLWGRQDVFGSPTSPRYIPPHHRTVGDQVPNGWLAWPAGPDRSDISGELGQVPGRPGRGLYGLSSR